MPGAKRVCFAERGASSYSGSRASGAPVGAGGAPAPGPRVADRPQLLWGMM